MTNCKSFTQLVSELRKEHGDLTRKLASQMAGAVVAVKTGNIAAGVQARSVADSAFDLVPDVHDDMVKAFNRIVTNTSWAHLGPRVLRLDHWERGTVVSVGDRTFLTAVPMDQDTVTLHIRERGGKNKIRVRVCAFDEDGGHRDIFNDTLNATKAERRDTREAFKIKLDGVRGQYLSVVMDGQRLAGRFKYKLLLDT